MSIESIIYAKNRHMFGGMEPQQASISTTGIRRVEGSDTAAYLNLKITVPSDTVVKDSSGNEQVVCSVGGVTVRRSFNSYPQNEFDGEEIANVTDSCEIIEDVMIGEDAPTYYYSVFTYSGQGVYNKTLNDSNRTQIDCSAYNKTNLPAYLYGYDLDTNDSNPETRVTYPADVDNAEYSTAYMDFKADTFNYGDWNITPGERFMPRPGLLRYDCQAFQPINPDDYSKTEDGSTSDIVNSNAEVNAMMEWPKIFTKRWEDENGVYHFRCSDVKIDDDYDCWCNYDANNNEIDHFYTAIYIGSSDGTRLRSLSGVAEPVNNRTVVQETSLASANDVGDTRDWYTEVYADRLLILDLLVMMSRSTDTQSKYGIGLITNKLESDFISTGTLDQKGMFWGSAEWGDRVKVFGMEDWWGGYGRRTAGLVAKGGSVSHAYVKITRGDYDGSGVSTYAQTVVAGIKEYNQWFGSIDDSGYISDMRTRSFGRIPYSTDGSSSTYECDRLVAPSKQTTSDNGKLYYLICGYNFENRFAVDGQMPALYRGDSDGAFAMNMDYASTYIYESISTALSCKPCVRTE